MRTDTNWIQTYSGRQFWPLDPRPDDLDRRDIAHGLALRNRFSGHTRSPYSVAQHSCLLASIMPRDLRLWALLHDASEAYLPDVCRPIKDDLFVPGLDPSLRPTKVPFRQGEDRLLRMIIEWAGLAWPMPPEVAAADLRLLATEAPQLLGPPPAPWTALAGVEPFPVVITFWDWKVAETVFLDFLGAWEKRQGGTGNGERGKP